MTNTEYCPCCGNHCKKGSFKCNKGAMYFAKLQLKTQINKSKVSDEAEQDDRLKNIVHLLKKVHHKIDKHKHEISLQQIFSILSEDEIKQLEQTLKNLKEQF